MVRGEDRRICRAAPEYLSPEHVRDVRRSRHVRGDPVCSVSVPSRGTTGFVRDSGDCTWHTIPICDGSALPHAILRLNVADRDLTELVLKVCNERGYSFSTLEREVVRCVQKEGTRQLRSVMVPSRRSTTGVPDNEKTHELPDGNIMNFQWQRFGCTGKRCCPRTVRCPFPRREHDQGVDFVGTNLH